MLFPKPTKKRKPKGKTARFSTQVKTEICKRDKLCILCSQPGHSCHHVYFGHEVNRGENRNEENQGVLLCFNCHLQVHSCSSGEGERQECIDYLEKYYEAR